MSTFGDIVRKHGFRNAGDNLLGFQIDVDTFLEGSELFEWVDVKQTTDDDCMLVARCKLKADVPLTQAKEDVCRLWESSLRYTDFADHSLEESDGSFILHFVTLARGLGVVGRIECFKENGEPEGATNGSQPSRSETNQTSSAAGSRC